MQYTHKHLTPPHASAPGTGFGFLAGAALRIILVIGFIWAPQVMAATLYKWRDANGRLQITDDPPPEGIAPLEVITHNPIPETAVKKSKSAPPGNNATRKDGEELQRRCQLIADSRRLADQARGMAISEKERSGEITRKLSQLRERTRFDDDEYDDFKDEILELEERARLAQSAARQADLMARQSELLKRTAELLAAGKCPDDY